VKRIIALLSVATLMVALTAGPALAVQKQEGLVNIALDDTTVQVPVAVAANICDVAVNVVAENTEPGETTTCEALAAAEAEDPPQGNQPSNQQQEGLINVALSDTTVQVPVAVAANICDVSVNVVAQNTEPGDTTTCEALAAAGAEG
jgi:hypothetical protein